MKWQDIDNHDRLHRGVTTSIVDLSAHAAWLAWEARHAGQLAGQFRLRAWSDACKALIAQDTDDREFYRSRVERCLCRAAELAVKTRLRNNPELSTGVTGLTAIFKLNSAIGT